MEWLTKVESYVQNESGDLWYLVDGAEMVRFAEVRTFAAVSPKKALFHQAKKDGAQLFVTVPHATGHRIIKNCCFLQVLLLCMLSHGP